jgi:hypothetical protein
MRFGDFFFFTAPAINSELFDVHVLSLATIKKGRASQIIFLNLNVA